MQYISAMSKTGKATGKHDVQNDTSKHEYNLQVYLEHWQKRQMF